MTRRETMTLTHGNLINIAEFASRAASIHGDVLINRGNYYADGKSILGLTGAFGTSGCISVDFPENKAFRDYLLQYM